MEIDSEVSGTQIETNSEVSPPTQLDEVDADNEINDEGAEEDTNTGNDENEEKEEMGVDDAINDEETAPKMPASKRARPNPGDKRHLIFPMSRTRKAIKLDPDVKNVKKDAVIAITKAVEFFVGALAKSAHQKVLQRKGKLSSFQSTLLIHRSLGGKTIRESDVQQAIYATDAYHFLKLDFPKKPHVKAAPKPSKSKSDVPKAKPVPRPKAPVPVASEDQAITRYFGGKIPKAALPTTDAEDAEEGPDRVVEVGDEDAEDGDQQDDEADEQSVVQGDQQGGEEGDDEEQYEEEESRSKSP